MNRTPPASFPLLSCIEETPRVLDVIGCHRETTVAGHVDVIRLLPLRVRQHVQLVEQYLQEPANYDGHYSEYANAWSRVLDYGCNYLALKLYDDVTRPELGEFLLAKGWKMIGYTTNKDHNKTYILEKWCNLRDH